MPLSSKTFAAISVSVTSLCASKTRPFEVRIAANGSAGENGLFPVLPTLSGPQTSEPSDPRYRHVWRKTSLPSRVSAASTASPLPAAATHGSGSWSASGVTTVVHSSSPVEPDSLASATVLWLTSLSARPATRMCPEASRDTA